MYKSKYYTSLEQLSAQLSQNFTCLPGISITKILELGSSGSEIDSRYERNGSVIGNHGNCTTAYKNIKLIYNIKHFRKHF